MNLLKIFTYGGIIEVFVVPHLLPCVMGFIPSHINDTIQLAVSLLSGLVPHISVNVQSEVFLKVWKEPGADQPTSGALPDFKSDSSSDGSSPSSGSPHVPAPYSSSAGCRPCGSGAPAPSQRPDTSAKPAPSGGGCPDLCRRLAADASKAQVFDQSAVASSQLSERSDLFARSCSAEYQVKPANSQQLVDWRAATGACSGAEPLVERLQPSFAKSCSLEYATVVRTPRADCANCANDTELLGTSVAELESRWTGNDVRNLTVSDGKAALQSKSSLKFAQSPAKLPANALVADEVSKPVYFGDNWQNP